MQIKTTMRYNFITVVMATIKRQKIGLAWYLTSVILVLWEAKAGGSLEARSFRLQSVTIVLLHSTLVTKVDPVSTKDTKISSAWRHGPVIPATWEAEAGESLEPGRQRLQWAKITPLHSSLANKSKTCSASPSLSLPSTSLFFTSLYELHVSKQKSVSKKKKRKKTFDPIIKPRPGK